MSSYLRPHVVYRVFSEDGALLYVGRTSDTSNRFAVHACQSPWWSELNRIEVSQTFKDERAADLAERVAIRDGQPLYNRWYPIVSPSCAVEIEFGPYVRGVSL